MLQQASRCGAIRVATLAELGVSPRTAYRRCLPGGPWQRPLPGIVLLTNMPPTRRQLVEAALLYGGRNALVSGLEACRRHGLRNVPNAYGIHLLVSQDRRLHSSDYVTVERTKRLPKPVVLDDLPLAPIARSVLDGCRSLKSRDPVKALIAEAVQRGRVSPLSLSEELEVGSQRGTAVPREVLKDITGGARSVAEIDAMRVWSEPACHDRRGMPRCEVRTAPTSAHPTHGSPGSTSHGRSTRTTSTSTVRTTPTRSAGTPGTPPRGLSWCRHSRPGCALSRTR